MKQKSHIRPIVYVMISVFLIIGYAYLTSSLTINGASLLKKATWDVHFENVQVKDGSVTGEKVIDEPELDSEQTTVTFHVNLKKPGDYYEFTVDAVNAGTIDAMINTYTEFDLTQDQLKYLETSVAYEDGEEIQEKQQLLAGDYAVYKIVVSFKKDLEADDLPDSPDQLDLEFTVEYVQKDDTAIERRSERSLYKVFENEAKNLNATIYTEDHQDSIDTSKSNKKIYYWYGNYTSRVNHILNRWNVIFGGFCWQMFRTTDTGGVKMIYNGIPNDGKCDNSRGDYQIGESKFNDSSNSPAYLGYMYNSTYPVSIKNTPSERIYSSLSLSTDYWYADSVEWGSPVGNAYNLVNPYQVSDSSEYSNLVGKYTFRNTSNSYTDSSVYYIAKVFSSGSNNYFYYIQLSNSANHNVSDYNSLYTYGDSYIDNGNGTYTIENPVTISRLDWYDNFGDIGVGKYVCKNAVNNTCSSLWYTITIRNYEMIYVKVENIKYANGFTYDENTNTYTLNSNSISFWNYVDSSNISNMSNHHYTCWNQSGVCSTISYIYYTNGSDELYYLRLNGGKNIEEALNDMFYADDVNHIDSAIKAYIDNWYQSNMTSYTSYLEDTVFCYDRSQSNSVTNGLNPDNGDITKKIIFNYDSLKCSNETDMFSLSNDKAKLSYPVGLVNYKELDLLRSSLLRKTGQNYYTGSLYEIDRGIFARAVSTNGGYSGHSINYASGVRPVVSLKPGTVYASGNGGSYTPFIVETN